MPSPSSEQVTCPSCSKSYRWTAALAGRTVPCKECGTSFIVPDQPGLGLADKPAPEPEPTADNGLYELAMDPDDEPAPPPPAYKSPPTPSAEDHQPNPAADPDEASAPADDAGDTGDADESHDSGPAIHISEAAKASRREEQRIAAIENEPGHSWRDHKGLIILFSVIGLFVAIYLLMYSFSDALD